MTAPTELLPCPFCGWDTPHVSYDHNGCAWVSCDKCLARSGGFQEPDWPDERLKYEAISEWNRRAPSEKDAQYERLRAECEGLRAAFKKTEYSLTKDSLCEAEKIDDALYVVRAALSQKETGDADR